jgi:leucyl-tRNA---protein transferase
MRHALPLVPQFYVTAAQTCPYLSGRVERKLFTALQGDHATRLNDALSKQGFRRSQNVLYRPACADCTSCYSARIRVADFKPTRGQRRILRRNRHLNREASTPWATKEQYQLFCAYLKARHPDGGMADMDVFEFAAMIEETPVRSRVVEYYRGDMPDNQARILSAVCLTDVLDDGLSMVYSFYEPGSQANSPGSYIILDHIEIAREAGLPYVYLGYWVPGSQKMGYKANFAAIEVFRDGGWSDLGEPAQYQSRIDPQANEPISEQVARISLPDALPSGLSS